MYLIVDTETTGLPIFQNNLIDDIDRWPRVVQLSWQVHDQLGNLLEFENFIIKPENYDIPFNSFKIHGITNEIAEKNGFNINHVLDNFHNTFNKNKYIIGHNLEFDIKVIQYEFLRKKKKISFQKKKKIDTKLASANFCKIPGGRRKFKWPTLTELYNKLFNEQIPNVHNAANDVKATARCFLELLRKGIISITDNKNHNTILKKKYPFGISSSTVDLKKQSNNLKKFQIKKINCRIINKMIDHQKYSYYHIHNHTHFSILHSTINIQSLIQKAVDFNMPAVGITDYGNLMGSFYFLNKISIFNKKNPKKKIKGIVGCEFFISENYLKKKFTKQNPDHNFTQILLAKNKQGYKNLTKISSIGYTEGFYSGKPRIGKNIIEKYKENLIALTGNINSEIPYTLLNFGEKKAEKIFLWWKNLFMDDFYIELFRHGLEEENYINDILIKFSKKYNVKYIAQNNVFYLDKKEYYAHDILLCIKNGEKISTPIGNGKGFRYGLTHQEYYFKNKEEMQNIFADIPESFHSLNEIFNKISNYHILNKNLLPQFDISNSLNTNNKKIGENDYLSKLTYEGAKKRYHKKINQEIYNRISFELETIKKIGYPGYFLIIQDIINHAKKMKVSVGPGRGSVAGSVVAYCLGITEIDPIKYNLLFERFLNPDRISLPDIDIDFDDKGRDKIIEWVAHKYGKDKVAQIITYSTMGAKSSIRDVSRVLGLSLSNADFLSKMIPNNLSLKTIFDGDLSSEKLNKEEFNNIKRIKNIFRKSSTLLSQVLIQSKILEGTIRSTSLHACGIIISPLNIQEIIPVCISKESNILVTQFDNNVIEYTGLLKMDFLGLKTLSIIKNTIHLIDDKSFIKKMLLLDDKKTYNLFQKGNTIAVFQYESKGMQKYLIKLKPDKFDDLIAMNALYRPGPMQYIPNFIARKNGKESITYDLPILEKFLKETYGITIYQEQVMLIAQELSNFSKGDADLLRKAIGKKKKEVIDKIKNQFINQSIKKGYRRKIIEKIWKDWEFFSCYAFNKSHSTCYANIAFQTAYLKTHFPCEYMSSVLSSNMQNIQQITFFMKECKRMNLFIKKPDINDSDSNFKVFNKNSIQFGLAGIKGVGKNAVKIILKERTKNGPFSSIFDFLKRIDLRVVNKKTLESLILSGSLDLFNINREQYFYCEPSGLSFLEKIMRFRSKKNKNNQKFNFSIPIRMNWNKNKMLYKEKEVLGDFLSSHPLDDYFYEMKYLTNLSINQLNKKNYIINRKNKISFYTLIGILSKIDQKIYIKNGVRYKMFLLEDYKDSKEFRIQENQYLKYQSIFVKNNIFFICISVEKIYSKDNKINIIHIEKIQNLFDKFVNELIIKINLKDLNNSLIDKIEKNILHEVGKKKFNIFLYDQEKLIKFRSQYRISINSNILKKLDNIEEIDFFLK